MTDDDPTQAAISTERDASRPPTSVPDTFLVGAPKCATTALAAWLDRHPRCSVTTPKEPHYWSFDLPGLRRMVRFDDPVRYASVVERARSNADVVVDASTTYLMSDVAVGEILQVNPGARFVAIVRDPMELVPSYFQTQRNSINEPEPSLARALERTAERRSGISVPERCADPALLDYQRVGKNGAHVQRLLRTAGAGQVMVIVYDDLRERPESVWRDLCEFLGLDVTQQSFDVIHPGGRQPRFATLHRFVHRPPDTLRRPLIWLRQRSQQPNSRSIRWVKQALWQPADRPVVDDRAAEIIRDWFRDDVELLSSTIGRDLSHWLGAGQR